MQAWNLFAELLGFASGILLLFPALSVNKLLRDVAATIKAFEVAKTSFAKAVAGESRTRIKGSAGCLHGQHAIRRCLCLVRFYSQRRL